MTGSSSTSNDIIRIFVQAVVHAHLCTVLPNGILFGPTRAPDFILTPADCRTWPDLGFRPGSGDGGCFRPGWVRRAAGGRAGRAAVVCGERAERSLSAPSPSGSCQGGFA